ncbi:MAG TPA: hypothetical protein VF316_12850, partial [Polyangiaceae bacterium]
MHTRGPMSSTLPRLLPYALCLAALPALAGCIAGDETVADESDITSLTARERKLTFEGYVYVDADASRSAILDAVRHETKSAFGAFLVQNISVSKRELSDVDADKFVSETVVVVDPATGKAGKNALRVHYRYEDDAIVPKTMTGKSAIHLGLLHGKYDGQYKRILKECTGNTADDREMWDEIWYVFDPSRASCQKAIAAEQTAIDADRADLTDGTAIVPAERDRLYIPMTARLEPKAAAQGKVYPEYDRLWSGGVADGRLVVSLLSGVIGHHDPDATHPVYHDEGYLEMLGEMEEILKARPGMHVAKTSPSTDLSVFTIGSKKATGVTFSDFIQWELHGKGFPAGFSSSEQTALRKAVGDRLYRRWITFEEQVSVKIGD